MGKGGEVGSPQRMRERNDDGAVCGVWFIPIYVCQTVELLDDVLDGDATQQRGRELSRMEGGHVHIEPDRRAGGGKGI